MATIRYMWDPEDDNIIMEKDGSGNVLAVYTHEPGLHGELISMRRDNQTNYFHYDGQGNTRALTDQNQEITDVYRYDAFGDERTKGRAPMNTTVNPFRFGGAHGYYTDVETGRVNVRARTYEPANARWTSKYPIGAATSANLYLYGMNNPLSFVDPSGLVAQTTLIGALLPCPATQVQDPCDGKWLELNVVFNVVFGTDSTKELREDWLKRANEILNQSPCCIRVKAMTRGQEVWTEQGQRALCEAWAI
ncbi:MAG: RHS repeat-associated core domain-containing protein [Planctomycetaceae bacterium]